MNLSQYLAALRNVFERPTANLPAVALIAAAVTLIILILCVLLLLLLIPGGRRPRGPRRPQMSRPEEIGGEEEKPSAPTGTGMKVRGALIVALVLTSFVVAYAGTGSDSYCTSSCHQQNGVALTDRALPHSGVRCVRCHESPLPGGLVANVSARLGHRVQAELRKSGSYDVRVAFDRCVACHDAVLRSVTTDPKTRVRMSHRAPLDAGMTCDDCHKQPGHGKPQKIGMSTCVRCHDGKRAAAGCGTCHQGDVGYAMGGQTRVYTQMDLPAVTCGGCHDQKKCDACHGLRMPHDQAFIKGGHARSAGFSKKALCRRCHVKADCGQCHGDFEQAHGGPAAWFIQHKLQPKDSPCNTCHAKHEGPMCKECH